MPNKRLEYIEPTDSVRPESDVMPMEKALLGHEEYTEPGEEPVRRRRRHSFGRDPEPRGIGDPGVMPEEKAMVKIHWIEELPEMPREKALLGHDDITVKQAYSRLRRLRESRAGQIFERLTEREQESVIARLGSRALTTCQSVHDCIICGQRIRNGLEYRNGGALLPGDAHEQCFREKEQELRERRGLRRRKHRS